MFLLEAVFQNLVVDFSELFLNWEWENRDFHQSSVGPIFANLGAQPAAFSGEAPKTRRTQVAQRCPVLVDGLCQKLLLNPLCCF